jgi:hypothetical protein
MRLALAFAFASADNRIAVSLGLSAVIIAKLKTRMYGG